MKSSLQFISKLNVWLGRYKYWLSGISFLIYMIFFDQYRIPVAISIYSNVEALEVVFPVPVAAPDRTDPVCGPIRKATLRRTVGITPTA